MTLLDTSAILVHAFKESGWQMVDDRLNSGDVWVASVTWLELRIALRRLGAPMEMFEIYRDGVAGTVDVSVAVTDAAFELRLAAGERLPAMDSLIAGAAKLRGFHLIHRDTHLAQIPQEMLAHTHLPARA